MDATPEEHWLPVVGYEGLYEVSNLGRVRSLDRMIPDRWGRSKPIKGKILAGSINQSTGYRTATLTDAAQSRTRLAVVTPATASNVETISVELGQVSGNALTHIASAVTPWMG